MDIQYVLVRLGQELDKHHYYGAPASDAQITAVRIYLQAFCGQDNARRYFLLQALFDLEETPTTSKILTKGQASSLISISRHEVYGPLLYEYIQNIA